MMIMMMNHDDVHDDDHDVDHDDEKDADDSDIEGKR